MALAAGLDIPFLDSLPAYLVETVNAFRALTGAVRINILFSMPLAAVNKQASKRNFVQQISLEVFFMPILCPYGGV